MKRQALPARPADADQGQAPAPDPTLDAARHALAGSAALLEWLGRWQAAATQALIAGHQAVQAARLDLAQARDASALPALQAELLARQFELSLEQAGAAWRLLLEDGLRTAEGLRDEALAQGELLLTRTGATDPPADRAAPELALETWQQAWTEMSQRWAEALAAGART